MKHLVVIALLCLAGSSYSSIFTCNTPKAEPFNLMWALGRWYVDQIAEPIPMLLNKCYTVDFALSDDGIKASLSTVIKFTNTTLTNYYDVLQGPELEGILGLRGDELEPPIFVLGISNDWVLTWSCKKVGLLKYETVVVLTRVRGASLSPKNRVKIQNTLKAARLGYLYGLLLDQDNTGCPI